MTTPRITLRPIVALVSAVALMLVSSIATSCSSSPHGGSSGANVCPEGPGQCQNGDSSTCRCGESCVQTAVCAGCGYECVKGCATDDDCIGYFSGDTPPAQLVCIGGSSSMPVSHCGIGPSTAPTPTSTTAPTATVTPPATTPCMMYASYDPYCTSAGYPAHFNQCINGETPAPGCENVLLTEVSCGQGGAGGTIRDCYCCP